MKNDLMVKVSSEIAKVNKVFLARWTKQNGKRTFWKAGYVETELGVIFKAKTFTLPSSYTRLMTKMMSKYRKSNKELVVIFITNE